jgi:hypothetical protein
VASPVLLSDFLWQIIGSYLPREKHRIPDDRALSVIDFAAESISELEARIVFDKVSLELANEQILWFGCRVSIPASIIRQVMASRCSSCTGRTTGSRSSSRSRLVYRRWILRNLGQAGSNVSLSATNEVLIWKQMAEKWSKRSGAAASILKRLFNLLVGAMVDG